MQDVTVATFDSHAPAAKLAEHLRTHGFHADTYDESNEQKWKLFNLAPRANFHVRVNSSDKERVTAHLGNVSGNPLLKECVKCPECGSLEVEFPQFSRRTLMGALPAALAATGVIEKNFYCVSCHHTWPGEAPGPEREVDILNWPKRKVS